MATYEFDRTTVDPNNGSVVRTIEYEPNGTDHRLQRRITELMDRIVQEDGRFTLAELGYLHMNTLLYNRDTGRVSLKIYFDVHYAARTAKDPANGKKQVVPVTELNIFEKRLFVGPLRNAVTFETVMAPKTKMLKDEKDRASISFKDDAKFVETDCLVLNCNLPIAMAALHDLSLEDPNFSVRCTTVGRGNAEKEKTIISSGKRKDIPVKVIVTAGQLVDGEGNEIGYDPSTCQTYLLGLRERQTKVAANREKIAEKARDKAEKLKKTSTNKNFNRFS